MQSEWRTRCLKKNDLKLAITTLSVEILTEWQHTSAKTKSHSAPISIQILSECKCCGKGSRCDANAPPELEDMFKQTVPNMEIECSKSRATKRFRPSGRQRIHETNTLPSRCQKRSGRRRSS